MISCSLCATDLQIINNSLSDFELVPEMKMIRDGVLVDYKCPKCDSRVRNRTLSRLLNFMGDFFLGKSRKLLLVSSPKKERSIISKYSNNVMHISLQGNFGDEKCVEGMDICDLKNIPNASFDFVLACCVLDYIPDLKKVFAEQSRILKSGGRFIFWIMPFRLNGVNGCRIKHTNALAHESYAHSGKPETGIPDCEFSVDWIFDQAGLTGLRMYQILMLDDISGLADRWFVAEKIG